MNHFPIDYRELTLGHIIKQETSALAHLESVDNIVGTAFLLAMEKAFETAKKRGARNPVFRSFLDYPLEEAQEIYSPESSKKISNKHLRIIYSIFHDDSFNEELWETLYDIADSQNRHSLDKEDITEACYGEIKYNVPGWRNQLLQISETKKIPEPYMNIFSGAIKWENRQKHGLRTNTRRREVFSDERIEALKLSNLIGWSRLVSGSADLKKMFSAIDYQKLSRRHSQEYNMAKNIFNPWYMRD